MSIQYTPYVLPFVLSAITLLVLGGLALRHSRQPAALFFGTIVLCSFIWAVGFVAEIISVELDAKIFWANIQFIGINFLPVAWLGMTLHFTDNRGEHGKTLLLLGLLPLATLFIIWTDGYHNLFRGTPSIDTTQPFPVLKNDYQVWFYWILAPYSYLLFLASFGLLLRSLLLKKTLYRRQIYILLISTALPLLIDVLYTLNISPIPNFNFAVAAFSLSAVMLAWGLFRFQLFDILPLARQKIIESMDTGILVLDRENRIVDYNPAVQKMMGFSLDERIGQQAVVVFWKWEKLREGLQGVGEFKTEIVVEGAEQHRHLEILRSPVYDKRKQVVGWTMIFHDITERALLLHRVKEMASTDVLTKIYNRRHLMIVAAQHLRIAKRQQEWLSLIVFDLDQFKQINDTFGHAVGDQVLRAVAERIQGKLRPTDSFGRMGGEEFAIILPKAGFEEADKVANRLCEALVESSLETDEGLLDVTASFGLLTRPPDSELSLKRMLILADQALYRAKESGGGRIAVVSPEHEMASQP